MRPIVVATSLVIAFGLNCAWADTSPSDLWNGATAGMNIDLVATRFPQAKAFTSQALEDGSRAGLSAPAQLAGAAATAVFFFRDRVLTAVIVENQTLKAGQAADNWALAQNVIGAARAEYGAPQSCVTRRELAAANCVWKTAALKVAVSYHDFGGSSPALSVAYSAAHP